MSFQKCFSPPILWKWLFKEILPFPFCENGFSKRFCPFHFVKTPFQKYFEVSLKWVKQKILGT
jgi:hypothetical protein